MELALLIDKQRLLTHGPVSLLGKCIKESKRGYGSKAYALYSLHILRSFASALVVFSLG